MGGWCSSLAGETCGLQMRNPQSATHKLEGKAIQVEIMPDDKEEGTTQPMYHDPYNTRRFIRSSLDHHPRYLTTGPCSSRRRAAQSCSLPRLDSSPAEAPRDKSSPARVCGRKRLVFSRFSRCLDADARAHIHRHRHSYPFMICVFNVFLVLAAIPHSCLAWLGGHQHRF